MDTNKKRLKEPVYISKPLLPKLENVTARMEEIWKSGWLTNMGSQHEELEKQLKEYLQVDNMTLFANGTLALILGIRALKLTGEVITTPFTFPATMEAIEWNGLKPVFCDVDSMTGTIDPSKIEALITKETSAIVGVHVFGNPCDVHEIEVIADKYGLKVIYDGAHSFGATVDNQPIGSFGDMTMFSFHATKLFNTMEGGALIVKDKGLLESLYYLKNFGIKSEEEIVTTGINGKMNELQAAYGIECLKEVSEERKKREQIYHLYHQLLDDVNGIQFIESKKNDRKSFQYIAIRVDQEVFGMNRDELFEQLTAMNIHPRKYFYPLLSNLSWTKHWPSSGRDRLQFANQLAESVMTLPLYGNLDHEIVELICYIIQSSSRHK